MNPVLIKPNSDTGAQIILQGKAISNMDAAGFHDLPHANRTANQMFGLSPSRALDSERVLLVPCAEPIAS